MHIPCVAKQMESMVTKKENLNRSWVAAFRWGYRKTDDKPTYGRNPRTDEERADFAAMRRFYNDAHRGLLPPPDRYIGKVPVWTDSTIETFINGASKSKTKKGGRPPLAKAGEVSHG